jgi:nicotinate-nucleotide adenylyltransferase
MKNRLGILGGTFNPVHAGHIELGLRALEAFDLDQIFYVLSAHPPHKKGDHIAPTALRWKMLNHALADFPQLVPCEIEMSRNTPSWTYDTIKDLKVHYSNARFYFICGSEGFLKIKTWKRYRDLLSSVSFIVVLRKPAHLKKIEKLMREERHCWCRHPQRPSSDPCAHVFSYQSEKLEISSTQIRRAVKAALPVDHLVDKKVKKMMEVNNLYGRE